MADQKRTVIQAPPPAIDLLRGERTISRAEFEFEAAVAERLGRPFIVISAHKPPDESAH